MSMAGAAPLPTQNRTGVVLIFGGTPLCFDHRNNTEGIQARRSLQI
jgi:hypothetical protein